VSQAKVSFVGCTGLFCDMYKVLFGGFIRLFCVVDSNCGSGNGKISLSPRRVFLYITALDMTQKSPIHGTT